MTPLAAASEAWKLSFATALKYDYLIAVASGNILGCFRIENIARHSQHLDRVMFKLKECSEPEKQSILSYINKEKIYLKRFVVKYLPTAI